MKINRNYRFVLTCMPAREFDQALQENRTGEFDQALQENRTGEFIYGSECHYYVEKEIISAIKDAAKANKLDEYRDHVYLIYKETKERIEKTVEEVDGKKITTETTIPGVATLIETIRLNGDVLEVR